MLGNRTAKAFERKAEVAVPIEALFAILESWDPLARILHNQGSEGQPILSLSRPHVIADPKQTVTVWFAVNPIHLN